MNWRAFKCKCCGEGEPVQELRELVDKIELLLGEELICNCGHRCEKRNKETKGAAPKSTHIECKAIDARALKATPKQIFIAAEQCGAGGIHAYEAFCHFDVGIKRRWK